MSVKEICYLQKKRISLGVFFEFLFKMNQSRKKCSMKYLYSFSTFKKLLTILNVLFIRNLTQTFSTYSEKYEAFVDNHLLPRLIILHACFESTAYVAAIISEPDLGFEHPYKKMYVKLCLLTPGLSF